MSTTSSHSKNTSSFTKRLITYLCMPAFLGMQLIAPAAQAQMVSTADYVSIQQGQADRDRILVMLDREDLKGRLEAMGVSAEAVELRVAAMSPAEASAFAAQLDNAPAGANGVVGALVLIFLVLLFTDLMGWTDVYPFVHSGPT